MKVKEKFKIEFKRTDSDAGVIHANLILPAMHSEYEDVMHKIRATETENEFEMHVATCEYIPGLKGVKITSKSIDELNYFEERLRTISQDELDMVNAIFIIKKAEGNFEEGISVKDLINMTHGLENLYVVEGMYSDKMLGKALISGQMEDYMYDMNDIALSLLEPEEVGRARREKEKGAYVNGKYITTVAYKLPEIYDGENAPEPSNEMRLGIVRLLVSGYLTMEQKNLTGNEIWLTLPASRSECERVAHELGKKSINECIVCDVRSAIPKVNIKMLSNTDSFEAVNKLALKYLNFGNEERIILKAIMEGEGISSADDALSAADKLHEYELGYKITNSESYAKEYLKRMLPENFDMGIFANRVIKGVSWDIIGKTNVSYTDYGYISKQGRGLFEVILKEQSQTVEQTQEENEEIEMGGMQM